MNNEIKEIKELFTEINNKVFNKSKKVTTRIGFTFKNLINKKEYNMIYLH